jgi:hypothetical protein
MTEILATTGPLNMFQFIINPESFGQSVENMYYLSLLFHDGVCGLRMTEYGEPLVCACLLLMCRSTLMIPSALSGLQ